MIITITDKDRKNKYKKLKKYKDKREVFLKTNSKDDLEKAFVKAFNEKDLTKRYSFIYDYMCKYLDENLSIKCAFKNNRCIANRLGQSVHERDGCCYYRKEGLCKFLKNKKCTSPNISCKLFMCYYMENKIIKMKSSPKNYLLLNYFFNRKQQEILKRNYRIPQKETIAKLLK